MKLEALIDRFSGGTALQVNSSRNLPNLVKFLSAGLLLAVIAAHPTLAKADAKFSGHVGYTPPAKQQNVTPQLNYDRFGLYAPFRNEAVVNRATMETLRHGMEQGMLKFSVKNIEDEKIRSFSSSNFFGKNSHSTECTVSLNYLDSHMVSEYLDELTLEEASDMIFYHEQTHCAENAGLFKYIEAYNSALAIAENVSFSAASMATESMADAEAMLLMSAKNPARADVYHRSFKKLRAHDAHNSHVDDSHNTSHALDIAYAAWQEVSTQVGLDNTAESQYRVEQITATIAGVSASNAIHHWMQNNPDVNIRKSYQKQIDIASNNNKNRLR